MAIKNSVVIVSQQEKLKSKQEYFYKYLQISPSYWLAHRKITLKEKIPSNQIPEKFAEVLALYKKVGDVFTQSFDTWWSAVGNDLFCEPQNSKKVLLTVDLTIDKNQLLRDYGKLLDELLIKRELRNKKNKIHFEVNKIRLKSLVQRHDLVVERSIFTNNKTKKEKLWSIGKSIGISSKWTRHIRLDSKSSSINASTRNYLSILVSKNLKDALTLAENAARGIFPSLQPTVSSLKFDYANIREIQTLNTKIVWNELLKVNGDINKYSKFIDPTNLRKRIKKIDGGLDLEEDYKKFLEKELSRKQSKKPITEYEYVLDAERRLLSRTSRQNF